MSALGDNRRRDIQARGRPMRLIRQRKGVPDVAVDLVGFPRNPRPQDMENNIQPTDLIVEILADEVEAARFPLPIAAPDRLMLDGRTTSVKAAWPVYDGALRIGFTLWVGA